MHRILVVEDEALIRMTVIEALEDAGFQVLEAASADEAVEMLNDNVIHFLFTDIQMPGTLSGVDLAHAVADRYPEAGIIVASGRVQPTEIKLPPNAEFFAKPFGLSDLVARVEQLARP